MSFKNYRAKLLKTPFISALSSLKLASLCFLLLIILVVWGTIYQTQVGLYLAQEKFFNSWLSFLGPIPFPSARTILWVLFINLSFALAFRFNYSWKNIGLLLNHFGIIALLFSGFLVLNFSKESFIKLYEGESSNYSESYYDWQLLVKDKTNGQKKTYKLDEITKGFKLNDEISVVKVYKNAQLFETPFAGTILKEMPIDKNYENNIPGLVLDGIDEIYLEAEAKASINNSKYFISLTRVDYELPFSIKLINVERELYPGTEIAKSYSSAIEVTEHDLSRKLTISMNKPFRSGYYTAFQASYGIDQDGKEFTILAVVKNLNYSLPYWATIVASLGLFIYFFQFLFNSLKRREENA